MKKCGTHNTDDHLALALVFARIHCLDHHKTFTLLFNFKSLDFETLSRVHVYCIEYVSYRLLIGSSQPQRTAFNKTTRVPYALS